MPHKPVLLQETLRLLALRSGDIVVDGTLGNAGHAMEIIKTIGLTGRLIGLDQDASSISRCQERLKPYPQATLHQENFINLDKILDSLNIRFVNAVLLDVGFSAEQIDDPERGFSFNHPGPLDMRMNVQQSMKARDLVNDLSEEDLAEIFYRFGDERRARKFAYAICQSRRQKPIETTEDLVGVLEGALPRSLKFEKGRRPKHARHHPVTRVFQALRIAVNDELGCLEKALPKIWERIGQKGRLGVITFHSSEDRIAKYFFRDLSQKRQAFLVTKKPVVPSRSEMLENRRARSAKLRVAEKTG
ncbi:MAG: 16S rRNA (cytosine(1402)-N(4))-methyltransferase RsmH [Candidatus Omnitrophica bacterium]|nr:16S rRNA (cytosine(1402)-N(4))-methyltransferase RsmH [Candidatus Omnitrophota bacterium]